jgi:uncharacterized protein (TIGR03792 family)
MLDDGMALVIGVWAMVVEWLVLAVPEEWHDRCLAADAAVWTAFLASCPGYVDKQVWVNPAQPGELIMVVRWESRAQWKAIPVAELARVEAEFQAQVGRSFEIVASQEYAIVAAQSG